ncbi:hypothetical protein ACFVWG_33055 [Kribbella sp. NPDC058245]|uniref:hypothetical protein n=1 Tax=Kribbella sp. NPDC058245 TaxID=3346399 RepID=UPI0036E04207
MPTSRRRKKNPARPSSGGGSAVPTHRPTPPPPSPPRIADPDWRARLEALQRLPDSDRRKWAELAALLAELQVEQPYRRYEPPVDKLVKPPPTRYKGPWRLAAQRAAEAREAIRDEIEQLGSRLHRYRKDNDEVAELTADSRDTYLATKSVTTNVGDPTKWVTPGFRWWIETAVASTGGRRPVEITLTVNANGVAQLRCGDELAPATPQAWTELTATALFWPPPPKRPTPTTPDPAQVTRPPVRRAYRLLGLALTIRAVFSLESCLAVLLVALVVSIAVVIVTALAKL